MQISVKQNGRKMVVSGESFEAFEVSSSLFRRSFLSLPPFSCSEEFFCWFAKTQYQVGKSYALWLLSRQPYHSQKLIEKLTQQGISLEARQKILSELERLGYLQDQDYMESLVKKEIKRGLGPYAIASKLKMKRIFPQNLEELLRKFFPLEDQKETIKKEIKRLYKPGAKKEKIVASLQRKGFSLDLIFSVLNALNIKEFSSWRN